MQDYAPLDSLPSLAIDSEIVKPSAASEVCSVLLALNPRKASGPYGLPCWLLREYAVFLAGPICDLLCCSFNEQKFPFLWKYADVTHLSQEKPVAIITKHVRPISFTPVISKVAEELIYRSKSRESCSSGYSPNQYAPSLWCILGESHRRKRFCSEDCNFGEQCGRHNTGRGCSEIRK